VEPRATVTWSARGVVVAAIVLAVILLVSATACQKRPLPESDTYAGQLYASRCGGCHVAFDPRSMTPAMWQVQVSAMQDKMRAAGIAPLTSEQRETIMDYLTRNSGAN
jgi:hypothetical protein